MRFLPRLPFLLYSYLASEMLAPFFASFIIMNCVFFLVKLIPFLNFVLELQISFLDFLRIFSYLFPNMFLYSIPMSAMIGVTIGFSRLSNDTEILAFKATGISLYQILPPVIIITVFISLITAYFSVILIPVSDKAIQQFTYQLLKEKVDKGIKERQFTEALGDIVVYVGDVDKKTGDWSEVWVSDNRGDSNPTITMAQTGRMKTQIEELKITILLENGSLHRPDDFNSQIVTFDNYKIHIPLKPPGGNTKRFNRGTLTMPQLLKMADDVGQETKMGKTLITEFHKRLVLPVGCLILTLIGLPLGLQARPGKKAVGIPLGLGIFIAYYVAFTFAKLLSTDSTVNIPIVMWTPNAFFSILTIIMIWRSANEYSLIPEKISDNWDTGISFLGGYLKPLFEKSKKQNSKQPTEKLSGLTDRLFKKKATIHANAKSRVFHLPECEFYNCKNCSIEFKNVRIALASNFSPCKFCKSLIDNNHYNKDAFS